ncbi:MAG: 4Fe-4S dicluster domain-containing protein [Thermodesulfovibrio sp.]
MNRRDFLKKALTFTGLTLISKKAFATDSSIYSKGNVANRKNWEIYEEIRKKGISRKESYAILVDLTRCIGCLRCEWACNEWNKNPNKPIKEFEEAKDKTPSVFDRLRRTTAGSFTVVNRFYENNTPVYVKKQCMHCITPACQAACFVDAFKKTQEGAVLYNPSLCVGCRYCMIACPFDILAYEYYDPITPQITKCTMCFDRIIEGKLPACVEICSADVMKFGPRGEIIKLAYEKISSNPQRYIPHIYGEHEVGGTSWLYISGVSFEKLGFPMLDKNPIPKLSKDFLFTIKVLEIVAALPLLWGVYYMISRRKNTRDEGNKKE